MRPMGDRNRDVRSIDLLDQHPRRDPARARHKEETMEEVHSITRDELKERMDRGDVITVVEALGPAYYEDAHSQVR